MRKERLNKLIQLFSQFFERPFSNSQAEVHSWVELNLEVIWVLTEDGSLQNSLRDYLCCGAKETPDLTENLKHNFRALDMTLEEELRGFSRMLDFVLDDVELRVNSDELFGELPKKYDHVAFHFKIFLSQTEALRDLERAYDFTQPKALVLLFLNHMSQVMSAVGIASENVNLMLSSWLSNHGLRACWLRFLDADLDFTDAETVLTYCRGGHDGWQELCYAFLCHASANNIRLPSAQLDALDDVVAKMGLDGAAPLLESGFLLAEGFSKQEKAATIYYLA